jgi:hypothetical protein
MSSAAAVLLATGGASALTRDAATSADAAWAEAVKSNSIEAFAEFVMAYPDSEHARAAYNRLSHIESATNGVGAATESGSLFGDEKRTGSSPGILPGTIMII